MSLVHNQNQYLSVELCGNSRVVNIALTRQCDRVRANRFSAEEFGFNDNTLKKESELEIELGAGFEVYLHRLG